MSQDQTRVNALYAKIEHFNRSIALRQIFEWCKTSHISLTEFNMLVNRVTAKETA
jgi:hypothetical protein